MRILMTTDTVGGVWTFSQELAEGLLEHGHHVLLVSFGRAPSQAQQERCDSLAKHHAESFRYAGSEIPLEWMDANQRVFSEGAALLRQQAANFVPGILHCSQFCYGAIDLPIPRVVTAHSDVLSWAKACRNGPLEDSPWLRRYAGMAQRGLDGADAVVTPTQWMLTALTHSFRLRADSTVIANGRSITGDLNGKRELQAVTAGRLWDEAKGIDVLRDVQSPVPVLIAGETRIDASARTLPEWCRLLGQVAESEMIGLLQRSSIYLCLSQYEPFGLAPLEAALCGCAVVARDIASLREVWGYGALYFHNAKALTALLLRLYENPMLLQRAREESYRRAQLYTRERMVEQYIDLFHRCLAGAERAQHAA